MAAAEDAAGEEAGEAEEEEEGLLARAALTAACVGAGPAGFAASTRTALDWKESTVEPPWKPFGRKFCKHKQAAARRGRASRKKAKRGSERSVE